jgi:hypothetical protein
MSTAQENGAVDLDAAAGDSMPIGTVDAILTAGYDLIEQTLEVPEWGCSIKIRTPTANDSARIKRAGAQMVGKRVEVDFAAMERKQFELCVAEPKFNEQQVLQLATRSGPGFRRVIDALDELGGGDDKEALRKAQREFQEPAQ